jgi:hypothetical protein
MTGFQKHHFTHKQLVNYVKNSLSSTNELLFLQKSLSGALHAVEKGGHVSRISALRKFKTVFEEKRLILLENNNDMLFTVPFDNKEDASLARGLMNELRQSKYSYAYSAYPTTSHTSTVETIKYFIRMFCSFYDFKLNNDLKYYLVSLLNDTTNFTHEKIIRLIHDVLLNPGVVHNKLDPYRNNVLLVMKLFDNLSWMFSKEEKFYDSFMIYFSNFSAYLNSPALQSNTKFIETQFEILNVSMEVLDLKLNNTFDLVNKYTAVIKKLNQYTDKELFNCPIA